MGNEVKETNKVKKSNKLMYLLIILIIVLIVIAVYALISNNNSEDTTIVASEDTAQLDENGEEIEESSEDYVITLEDESKYNISTALSEEKEVNGLSITNIQLTYNTNGNSVLLADVRNETENTIEEKTYTIDLVDENGTIIKSLPGVIEKLEPGESAQLNVAISANVANAYNFIIHE